MYTSDRKGVVEGEEEGRAAEGGWGTNTIPLRAMGSKKRSMMIANFFVGYGRAVQRP